MFTAQRDKSSNGTAFKQWLDKGTLGLKPIDLSKYERNNDNAVFRGPDAQMMSFAKQHLGYKRDKGIDFLGRFNGKYVIGEAKFISDEGGHQNDQFLDAMTTIQEENSDDVRYIAILDGVLYIPGRKKMYTMITSQDIPVMSALLLRDYLYNLE